jgi:hypothetical protein
MRLRDRKDFLEAHGKTRFIVISSFSTDNH